MVIIEHLVAESLGNSGQAVGHRGQIEFVRSCNVIKTNQNILAVKSSRFVLASVVLRVHQ